jgi:cell division protein FtsI/penicillin-binding protein 2
MSKRLTVITYIFLSIMVLITIRITYLIFTQTQNYKKPEKISGNRGLIVDRNEKPLAISYKTFSIFCDPSTLSESEKKFVANTLSRIVNQKPDEILSKLRKNSKFVWIARKIPEEYLTNLSNTIANINANLSKGKIELEHEFVRRYPLGEKASGIVGTVGIDNQGLSGIEFSFNDILTEKNYTVGKVVLSIDKYIQEIAYIELAKSVEEFGAEMGIVIIANKRGEILAMNDYPSYNPYDLSTTPSSSKAVNYIIEPGSVMKIPSMTLAISKKPSITNTKYECTGTIKLFNHTIVEPKHGIVIPEKIIAYSCNVGMIKVSEVYEPNELYFFLKSLGFGEKTFIGLPGEEKGILKDYRQWSGITKQMISIGQEIGVTGIQLLKMGLIIANDGILVNPKLIKFMVLPDGEIKKINYNDGIRIIPEYAVEAVKSYMRKSVEYGTSKLAEIESLEIGGKTGTGQIFNISSKKYFKDKYNSVFLGILPYKNTKLVGIVILVNPQKQKQGGLSAAPTLKRILEKIVAYDPSLIQTQ